MKITFLLTQDLSSPSGLGRYFPWAKELVKLGYDVRIIALHPDFAQLKRKSEVIEGVRVDYVAQMHVRKSGNSKTYFSPWQLIWVALIGTFKLTLAAAVNSGDVLLIGKPHPMNSIAALVTKVFRPKAKIILDCDDYEAGSNRFQAGWQQKLVAWFEDYVPRKAQLVTSNTYFNLHRLEAKGIPSGKLVYVPNGIDPERFRTPDGAEVSRLRASLLLNDKKVISYLGSMSLVNHAVDLLLRAFVQVHLAIPEARLVLVGGGEDLDVLKNLAQELGIDRETIFTGRVDPDKMVLYYALSDVTVDPVRDNDAARGRCPLKMFESWACGVPFVTADVGDRKELAGEPEVAFLVEAGNEKMLAFGLSTVLTNPDIKQRLSDAATKLVNAYTWQSISKRTNTIIFADLL